MMPHNNEFSVFIGLDWANRKHDVCVQKKGETSRDFKVIAHSPEAIEQWIQTLYGQCKGQIAIAIELDKGPIVYALQKYRFVTIFPIHAATLAKYRQTFTTSGAKNDPTDAEIALDMMLKFPDKIKPLSVQSDNIRKLQRLVEQRRDLVDDRRRFSNRLISALKQYYPQLLDWFSRRHSELFCDFICRWPTLQQLQRARENTVRQFFLSRGGNACTLLEKRIKAIQEAIPLTNDTAVIEPYQLLATVLASQIITTVKAIKRFDKEIELIFESMDDAPLFKSLPGTGPCLAPRLLVAFGEDRKRFSDAKQVQSYAGVAPVTVSSGQKTWVHWRWQCAKFVRQSFIEWSAKTVHRSYWAGLFYNQQRQKGNSHQSAVRALAYKWIRILFRCWKNRIPYDESKYLKALRERNSPLLMN